jgi:UDP-3-O-acyl-N-acetylglucosamine deacetylase
MQKTLKKSVCCSGIDITGRGHSRVIFRPAPPGSGIIFVREDLPGQPRLECRPEHAQADCRWTSLVKGPIRVDHTEHILAAVAGLGIGNITIHTDSQYLPVVSGFSGKGFVDALLKGGTVIQDGTREGLAVDRPCWVLDSFTAGGRRYDSLLLALPAEEFMLTYLLDYPGRQAFTQAACFAFNGKGDFASELAPSRSYVMDFERDSVRGLIGRGMEECLVLPQDQPHLQWDNEPARHKLLDMLGDLAILGRSLKGHFIGIRTGHKANIRMCKKLAEAY